MNIKEAIAIYNKSNKEYQTAAQKATAATEAACAAWDQVKSINKSFFDPNRKQTPEYTAAMEASEAETAAHKTQNIAKAVKLAASYNVLVIARNKIYDEVMAAPEKYNKPVHFKVMKDKLNAITGTEDLYIYISYSSVYLAYRAAAGEREIFLFDTDNENKLNLDRPYLQKRDPENTFQQIKKEVKQAARDAEKLRKAAEELYKTSENMQAKYTSYIKHLMPYANKYNLEDKYRLF